MHSRLYSSTTKIIARFSYSPSCYTNSHHHHVRVITISTTIIAINIANASIINTTVNSIASTSATVSMTMILPKLRKAVAENWINRICYHLFFPKASLPSHLISRACPGQALWCCSTKICMVLKMLTSNCPKLGASFLINQNQITLHLASQTKKRCP